MRPLSSYVHSKSPVHVGIGRVGWLYGNSIVQNSFPVVGAQMS